MASATKLVKTESQAKQSSIAAPRLLTAEDVAQITGLSIETLVKLKRSKRNPSTMLCALV
jgi:DNA-binding XRE family transcriptional regulator